MTLLYYTDDGRESLLNLGMRLQMIFLEICMKTYSSKRRSG